MKYKSTAITIIAISLLLLQHFPLSAQPEQPLTIEDLGAEEVFLEGEIFVVTAARRPQRLREAPSTIEVITEEDIKDSGAITLRDALNLLAGIDFRRAGTKVRLSFRGLQDSEKVLFMMDGRPLNGTNKGVFPIDYELPLTNIKSIEVIKGPGSALYGPSAFTGVVNIITKSGANINGGELSAEGGSDNTQHYQFLYGRKGDEIEGIFTVRKFKTGGQELVNDNEDFDDLDIFAKFTGYGVTLSLGYYDVDRDKAGSLSIPTPEDKKEEDRRFAYLIYEKGIDNLLNLKLTGYINKYNSTITRIRPWGIFEDKVKEQKVGGEMQTTWHLHPQHTITSGLDFRRDEALFFQQYNKNSTNTGIYLEDEYKPFDRLALTLGGRYDIHSIYEDVFSPRAAAVYQFNDQLYTKVSYGEAFRAPTFAELFTDNYSPAPGIYVFGNPNLKPEQLKTYEFGLSYHLNRTLESSLNFFYIKAHNLITGRANMVNQNRAEVKGFEVNIDHRPLDWLKYFANYSYQESTNPDTNEANDYAPKHKANVGINIKPHKYLTINSTTHWVAKRNSGTETLGEYTTTDLKLSTSCTCSKRADLWVTFYNLFDEEYQETSNYPAPAFSWLAGLGYRF
ncbi:MAG: TonB-dependent receptor plug domain-containing protein [Thermodesulfobacteriota bacterium]